MDDFRSCGWCGKTIGSALLFCSEKCRHEYNTKQGTEHPLVNEKYVEFIKEQHKEIKKTLIFVALFTAGGLGVFPILDALFGIGFFIFIICFFPLVMSLIVGKLILGDMRRRKKYR